MQGATVERVGAERADLERGRPPPLRASFRTRVGVIALAGFGWRVAYVLILRRGHLPFGGDALQYSYGANDFVRGHGFVNAWAATGLQSLPSATHPPLYTLWLAIPSWLWHGDASQLTHMLWTCVLDIGTIVVVAATARAIAGDRAGVIAAVLAAVYPNIWVHDGLILSEPIAIFTLAVVIWSAYRFAARPTLLAVVVLGAACGVAALARPELLLLAPLLVVPLALFCGDAAILRRVAWVAVGGLAALVVIAPWVVYNESRFNEHLVFTTNFGSTLVAANCDAVYYGDAIGYKSYWCAHNAMEAADRPGEDESQHQKELVQQAKIYIKAHLGRVPVVVLARWGRSLEVFRPNDDVTGDEVFGHREPFVSNLAVYSFDAMLALAVAGVFVMRARRARLLPVLAPVGVVFVSIGLTFAQTRYRAPAEVPLVLLAAVALDAIIGALRRPEPAPRASGFPAPARGLRRSTMSRTHRRRQGERVL